jgi:SPP1 family predicted phage head-tail adaptor
VSLPKKLSTGVRYLPSSAFNCYVTFLNPNAGQAADGTPNAALTVATGIHANVSPWRSKEVDKSQTRTGQSAFKIVIRYPRNFTVDSGMQLQLTRAEHTTLYNIESVYDPDAQGVELHIWCWTSGGTL